jgi:hypothetical protein
VGRIGRNDPLKDRSDGFLPSFIPGVISLRRSATARYQVWSMVLGGILTGGMLVSGSGARAAAWPSRIALGTEQGLASASGWRPVSGAVDRQIGDSTEARVHAVLQASVRANPPGPSSRQAATRQRSAGKRALIGGAIGAAGGAVFGLVAPSSCCVPFGWSRGEAVALWSGVGAASGILVAVVVGSSGGERRAAAGLTVGHHVRPARAFGIRVGYRLSLQSLR